MKIIYKNESGGVSIIHPTDEALSSMTIDEIAKTDVPTGVKYKIVEDSEVPTDRTFGDAWEVGTNILTDAGRWRMINVNLDKAKDIANAFLRNQRAELFKPLDVEATIPQLAEQAEAKRSEIRDRFAKYQDDIAKASSVASLKATMLQCKEYI